MKRSLSKGKKTAERLGRAGLRAGLLGAAVLACGACNNLDTTREAGPKGTLGDDLFGVMCDRVGASSLPEDLSGDSYQSMCHFDAKGHYGDKVDVSQLPPPGKGDAEDRKLALAKMDAMVAHRSDLIRAFNAAFPDIKIPDTQHKGKQIRLHDALMDFSQRLAPLYDENPYIKNSEPLLPATTRALGRLFDKLGGHNAPTKGKDPAQAVLEAFQTMTSRKAYRPYNVALGALRPVIAYPELRELTNTSLKVLGPTGVASPELQQLLAASKQELLTSRPLLSKLPTFTLDRGDGAAEPAAHQPRGAPDADARPERRVRGVVERPVALHRHPRQPRLRRPDGQQARRAGHGALAVRRHGQRRVRGRRRLRALPRRGQGPALAPDSVLDSGRAGRRGRRLRAADEPGLRLRRHVAHAARRGRSDLVPLLDATKQGNGADAWQQEHETVMYAMGGAYLLYGDREAAQYDYAAELAGAANPIRRGRRLVPRDVFNTPAFKGKSRRSPTSRTPRGRCSPTRTATRSSSACSISSRTTSKRSRASWALCSRSARSPPSTTTFANQGSEPFASLDYDVPIWDEMAGVIARIFERPGLTAQLLGARADPTIVTPQGGAKNEGETMSRFFGNKDFMTYDPNNINGPAINVTVGGSSTADPQTPVDWTQPQAGNNRSIMQRSFEVIHDANHAVLCNKDGAVVATNLGVDWPLFGSPYSECELFKMDNAAVIYLDTILPLTHPKHSQMPINPNTGLSSLLDLGDYLGLDIPSILYGSSGIDGVTVDCQFNGAMPSGCATSQGLNRLLYFGADTDLYPNMPDHDSINEGSQTNDFIHKMMDAASTVACPVDGMGMQVSVPTNTTNLFRVRDFGTMFAWERLGYYNYLEPMVRVFADQACSADESSVRDTTDYSAASRSSSTRSTSSGATGRGPSTARNARKGAVGNAQTNVSSIAPRPAPTNTSRSSPTR